MATYYTAWADDTETTFGVEHHITDLDVFAFELVQGEGEFAELRLDILNPRIGLLHASRKQWIWFAHYDDVSTTTALFFGRLLAIPQDLHKEVVRLTFLARPGDYDTLKRALADTLKVLPYYDIMFFAEDSRADPDTALEARHEMWHIDRTSHAVTTSNITTGEDGTLSLGTGIFYDSLSVSHNTIPLSTVRVTADVNWNQAARKSVNITSKFGSIPTLTGFGLFKDWPKPGVQIGQHWEIASTWNGAAPLRWETDQVDSIDGPEKIYLGQVMEVWGSPAALYLSTARLIILSGWTMRPTMTVRFDVQRDYGEKLTFDLSADTQPMAADLGDDDILDISFAGDADVEADDDGSGGLIAPIRDLASRRYFPSPRGSDSIKFLILAARAKLLFRARAVHATFETPIENGFNLSLRHDCSIDDDRLPGGSLTGKVISYVMSLNGDTGESLCSITVACTVGNAGTVSTSNGVESYVDTGYVEASYQWMNGETLSVLADEVHYTNLDDWEPDDDGIDLTRVTADQAVTSLIVNNPGQVQGAALRAGKKGRTGLSVREYLKQNYTQICLKLHEFDQGPFDSEINLTVSELKVPKTINLASDAT